MKKIYQSIRKWFITILTVYIASSNINIIYYWLKLIGIENKNFKTLVLSTSITIAIVILEELCKGIYKLIMRYFSKIIIESSVNYNHRKCKKITFKPKNEEYEQKEVILNIRIIPKGKILMKVLKLLKFKFTIFFNPEILDIEPSNNPNFSDVKDIESRNDRIDYFILENYDINAINQQEFNRSIKFIIKPKRVGRADCNLSYNISSNILKSKVKYFCKFEYDDLFVICNEG